MYLVACRHMKTRMHYINAELLSLSRRQQREWQATSNLCTVECFSYMFECFGGRMNKYYRYHIHWVSFGYDVAEKTRGYYE